MRMDINSVISVPRANQNIFYREGANIWIG